METAGAQTITTWYGASAGGDFTLTVSNDDAITAVLTDFHGDTALAVPLGLENRQTVAAPSYDEYGNKAGTTTAELTEPLKQGYLASHGRSTNDSGFVLMGARLYNSTTGLFTSIDPVVGGNLTAYGYPLDPVNNHDACGEAGQVIVGAGGVAAFLLLLFSICHCCRDSAMHIPRMSL